MIMKTQQFKIVGHNKGSPERKIYSGASLSQETRKVSNTQPNPTPKGAGERTRKKA